VSLSEFKFIATCQNFSQKISCVIEICALVFLYFYTLFTLACFQMKHVQLVHTHDFSLGELKLRLCKHMFRFKNCYEDHVININVTSHYLHLHLYTHKHNYMFHDSLNLNHKV
jgi:hypothetical protein